MRLIAVGRMRPGPEAELCARYVARLRPKLTVTELPDGHGAPAEVKRREAVSLLSAITPDVFAVALDLGRPAPSSEGFSTLLEGWLGLGRPLAFLIGGAEGLASSVLSRADHVLSLGPLTWPHLLARVMLVEQLYRARAIAAGHPYHRGSRPD